MAYQYRYKPPSARRFSFRGRFNKNARLMAVFVGLVLVFSVIGFSITGFVSYAEGIEHDLNRSKAELNDALAQLSSTAEARQQCNTDLSAARSDATSCRNDLENSEHSLVSCQSERTDLQGESEQLNAQLTSCVSDKGELEASYEQVTEEITAKKEEYDDLVRGSVRGICCSVSDVISGIVKEWSISGGAIECEAGGAYTVDCGTGITTY